MTPPCPSGSWRMLASGRTTARSGGHSQGAAGSPSSGSRSTQGYAGERTPDGFLTVSLLAAVWVVAFHSAFAAGHYTVDSTITVAIGTVTGLVLASAVNEWVPGVGLTAPRLLATAALIFGLVAVWEWLVRRTGVTWWRVLVVGSPGIADSLVEEVRRTRVPFEVVGTVGDTSESSSQGVPLLGAVADLPAIVEDGHPELIVLADGPACDDAVERLLQIPRCRFRVIGLSSFYEWAFGRVPVPYLTPAWFMSLIHLRQRVSARWSKRMFDVVARLARPARARAGAGRRCAARCDDAGADHLQADPHRRAREAVHDLQVPDDERRRGERRRRGLGQRRRPARDAHRVAAAADAPGRASAAA